jgi:hypothetical protein
MRASSYFLLFGVLILFSCNGEPKLPPDSSFIKTVFGDTLQSAVTSPEKINIIIDGSFSMNGFAGINSNLYKIIRDIIHKLPNESSINFYKLDSKITKFPSASLSENLNYFQNKKFFNGTESDFYKIFEHRDVIDLNNLTLFFTDLIYSKKDDKVANQMLLFSRELKKLVGNNGLFAVYGKVIQFDGDYYVECKPPTKLSFNDARPVFCLALGHQNHYDFLNNIITPIKAEKQFSLHRTNPKFSFEPLSKNIMFYNDNKDTTEIVHLKIRDSKNLLFAITSTEQFYPSEIKLHLKNVTDVDTSYLITKTIRPINVNIDSISNNVYYLNTELPIENKQLFFGQLEIIRSFDDWIKEWSTDCDNTFEGAKKVYGLDSWFNTVVFSNEINQFNANHKYFYIWR